MLSISAFLLSSLQEDCVKNETAHNENAVENSATEAFSGSSSGKKIVTRNEFSYQLCFWEKELVFNAFHICFPLSLSLQEDCFKNESAHNENAVEDSGLEAFGGSSSGIFFHIVPYSFNAHQLLLYD